MGAARVLRGCYESEWVSSVGVTVSSEQREFESESEIRELRELRGLASDSGSGCGSGSARFRLDAAAAVASD